MRWKIVDFGSRLKELRKQAGLTQKQLGDRLGITKSVVSFYELRERTPSPEVLVKMAEVFHVTTDFLLGIEKGQTIDVSGLDDEEIATISKMISLLQKNKKQA